MNEKTNLKKSYTNYDYLCVLSWRYAHTYEQTKWNMVSMKWEVHVVEFPARFVRVALPGTRIDCLDNKWEYRMRWHHYRSLGGVNERSQTSVARAEAREERYPVRFRARREHVPEPWNDEIYPHVPKRSWKRSHKIRKQWMKNL